MQHPFKNIFCFTHLRWDFVFQRPQHLFSRFATGGRVVYWEEPVFDAASDPYTTRSEKLPGLTVVVPHLAADTKEAVANKQLQFLLQGYLNKVKLEETLFWYYTPMALSFSGLFQPAMTVYDCMDELAAFDFAPAAIATMEHQLMARADIVFTGGFSLYEAKKSRHHNIHPFPSSIDREHFAKARTNCIEPECQRYLPHPRIGFFGVIDERFDTGLIREIAAQMSDWHFMLVGPVVKIDPATLPRAANIHYTGQKKYGELPGYLSGWDVALIPFALNKSTRFISPTKTPEYLAAGVPVVSSPIHDVVFPYGKNHLVHIGRDASEFIACIRRELTHPDKTEWMERVNRFLEDNSWDKTFEHMQRLITETYTSRVQLAS